jgi:phosphopantetheinyl transferase (holo-ACP synthase)
MPFSVKAYHSDHPLTVTKETAKEAFAKAIEWQVAERFADVTISHDNNTYSIDEFALMMARLEIETTLGRKNDEPADE